jgi:hypothetical protein
VAKEDRGLMSIKRYTGIAVYVIGWCSVGLAVDSYVDLLLITGGFLLVFVGWWIKDGSKKEGR